MVHLAPTLYAWHRGWQQQAAHLCLAYSGRRSHGIVGIRHIGQLHVGMGTVEEMLNVEC